MLKSGNISNYLSVVITRYSETDKTVLECLNSLSKQRNVRLTIWFLDQIKSSTVESFISKVKNKFIKFKYKNIPAKSLSFARNTGLKISTENLVAFCDSDCVLSDNWASEIIKVFKQKKAAIVGTKIVPKWATKTYWFHNSKIIGEFYSLLDFSNSTVRIHKVVGASFAINKKIIGKNAYFDENLGRRPDKFIGGEETDLCQRVINNGGKIYYTPHAIAFHQISNDRIALKWIFKRAYFGGYSRALRGGRAQPFNRKINFTDKLATLMILPFYIFGYIRGKMTL